MLDASPITIAAVMAGNERAFYIQLGQRIAALRKAQGITQVQLAEQLGVARQTMAHYEGGTVRIAVETLATVLDTPIEDLIGMAKTKTTGKRGPRPSYNYNPNRSAACQRRSRSSSARCSTPCCNRLGAEKANACQQTKAVNTTARQCQAVDVLF